MAITLIFIAVFGLIIYVLNCIAQKSPKTNTELRADIKYSVNRLAEKYDFDTNQNIQNITNIKKNGWYVSDCGEYFHIIKFEKNGDIKLSSASISKLHSFPFIKKTSRLSSTSKLSKSPTCFCSSLTIFEPFTFSFFWANVSTEVKSRISVNIFFMKL